MAKKLPKTLAAELKHHDFGTRLLAISDYRTGVYTAPRLVSRLKAQRKREAHIGDPCKKCGVPHDEVEVGACKGGTL